MAQFIRYPYDKNNNLIGNVNYIHQVCYISYQNDLIEVLFDENIQSIIVDDINQTFWLTCIDIPYPTIRQILVHLGCENEQMIVTWSENGIVDAILNTPINVAPVCNITVCAPNQPIPFVIQ